jgi:hypothetical protein
MAVIPKDFGEGGSYLTPGASGEPSLPAIIRDIATDLHTLNSTGSGIVSPVTAGALAAFTDPPTAAEMAALRTLVNQIRAHLIAGGSSGGGAALLTALPA